MFKVGDIVTQNDMYYKFYKSEPFHLKIKKIKGDFVQLDGELLLPIKEYWMGNGRTKRVKRDTLHVSLIQLDIQYARKLKLRILNDKNNMS